MKFNIRPAQANDIHFLAWAMYEAARSHLTKSPWSVIFGEAEAQTRRLLENTIQIPELYWSCLANFRVVEIETKPIAAMCAFAPVAEVAPALADLQLSVLKQNSSYPEKYIADVRERLAIAALGLPEELPDAWGIESVAVLPEFRGKGVVDELFNAVLEEGRKKGFKRAQIMCLIGNNRGQQTFERNGFTLLHQETNSQFEDLFGTPGAQLFIQDI